MTLDEKVIAFANCHFFDASELPEEELDAIRCMVSCHNAIAEGYAHLPTNILEEDPAVGPIWQLYERCYERICGAIVAFATACVAASEIVARASIEASTTFRYILQDRNPRLASFLRNHVEQAEKQLKQWRKAAEGLQGNEKAIHIAACEHRRQGITVMNTMVEEINSWIVRSAPVPVWPSIAARFEALGEAIQYRTFYTRLCAEPHFDAEETLRYFIGTTSSRERSEAMAIETVMFSRFMLAEAVRVFAKAGIDFAIAYQMNRAAKTCGAAEHLMSQHTWSLSSNVGGGFSC